MTKTRLNEPKCIGGTQTLYATVIGGTQTLYATRYRGTQTLYATRGNSCAMFPACAYLLCNVHNAISLPEASVDYTYNHACSHICMCIHTHIHAYTHIHTHHAHSCIHTHTYTTRTFIHKCMHTQGTSRTRRRTSQPQRRRHARLQPFTTSSKRRQRYVARKQYRHV